jgi:predicted lipoprotein with Yx(FWY)xxD motif
MMIGWRGGRARGRAFLALTGVALVAAGCGGGRSSPGASSSGGGNEGSMSGSSPPTSGVVVATANAPEPTHLTGADGQALYLWEGDSDGKSNCSGDCASQWPPLITKTIAIPSRGVTAAGLGTITRPDGSKQVTYMGHPLYSFAGDVAAGAPLGEGLDSFGARWWMVAPSGAAIKNANPPPTGY